MAKKTIYEIIVETYPELAQDENAFIDLIKLRNDSDGTGDYIFSWGYSQPIPDGLTLGKSAQ
jgi:hypothetical protein